MHVNKAFWRRFEVPENENTVRAEIALAVEVIRKTPGWSIARISKQATGDGKALAAYLKTGAKYRRLRFDDVRKLVEVIDAAWRETQDPASGGGK